MKYLTFASALALMACSPAQKDIVDETTLTDFVNEPAQNDVVDEPAQTDIVDQTSPATTPAQDDLIYDVNKLPIKTNKYGTYRDTTNLAILDNGDNSDDDSSTEVVTKAELYNACIESRGVDRSKAEVEKECTAQIDELDD